MRLSAFLPGRAGPEARKERWEQEFVCTAQTQRAQPSSPGSFIPRSKEDPAWCGRVSAPSICPHTHSVVTNHGLLKGPQPTLEASCL